MGSRSDWETMRHAADTLEQLGIPFEKEVVSAHRTPDKLYEYASSAEARGLQVVIAGAGGAAHLPGMTASKTLLPVLGVPVETKALQGLDSLLSIAQMPAGVPSARSPSGVQARSTRRCWPPRSSRARTRASASGWPRSARRQTAAVLAAPDPLRRDGRSSAASEAGSSGGCSRSRAPAGRSSSLPRPGGRRVRRRRRRARGRRLRRSAGTRTPRRRRRRGDVRVRERAGRGGPSGRMPVPARGRSSSARTASSRRSSSRGSEIRNAPRSARLRARSVLPALVKSRRFGYDGKGQLSPRRGGASAATSWPRRSSRSTGSCRSSRSRGSDGSTAFYPLAENEHRGGILRRLARSGTRMRRRRLAERARGEAARRPRLRRRARDRAVRRRRRLLANELAPRVHNSGHWTIEGAVHEPVREPPPRDPRATARRRPLPSPMRRW